MPVKERKISQKKNSLPPEEILLSDYWLFFQWCWPIISQEKLIVNWHMKVIARRLQYLGMHIINRTKPDNLTNLFSVPPGSSKSSLISQCWLIWLWLLDPSVKMMNVSYADGASLKNSFNAKKILRDEEFKALFGPVFKQMHGKELNLIRDLTDEWENNFGGMYYSTSITGQATAYHFHVIVFDDPMNAEVAYSDAKRAGSNRMHDATFPSRKVNKEITPTIYVAQRFHEDDTLGHVMKKNEPYYYLCLPAELSDKVSPPEMADKYTDGLLDPIRLNHEVLDKAKNDLGSFGYSGQYGQNPFPEGGGKIKKEWFCKIDEADIPKDITWDLWIDGAYTEKKENDPTGFVIAGHDIRNNRLIICHASLKWMTIPDVIERINELHHTYLDEASMIYIEPKASGYSFIQLIQDETYFNVSRITGRLVQDGKAARVNYAAPKIESSRVYLVGGNWNDEFITQLCAFPNYSHDEYCDLLGYACKKYFS
jgi:predicted phage terminase large subunit-like protein